jgi:cation diffusion facilitator family transporter
LDQGSRKVILAALIGNALVAAAKFAAAAFTHSAAMLSEAVHSLVDTSNELLLIYGSYRAKRPPDRQHPLGYGREVYFWSFIVSLLVFLLGALASIGQGISHLLSPVEIEYPAVNYAVLGIAAVLEAGSWWVSFRVFRARKGGRSYLEAAEETKDPSVVIVFLEDSAALVGIAFAFAGNAAAQVLGDPRYDAAASVAIGLLLAMVAAFLARRNKDLLIGESADPRLVKSVARIARSEPGVARFNGLLTIHLAPQEVVATLSLDFDESLHASGVEAVVANLERRIRRKHPEIVMVLIKPQTPKSWRKSSRAWLAKS